jgi:hypothetical protein
MKGNGHIFLNFKHHNEMVINDAYSKSNNKNLYGQCQVLFALNHLNHRQNNVNFFIFSHKNIPIRYYAACNQTFSFFFCYLL